MAQRAQPEHPDIPDIQDSIRIDAPAGTVYSMVSELTRMGEWSPENRGARWSDRTGRGPSGPAAGGSFRAQVGDRFVGYNRAGWLPWSTVTESWTDRRPAVLRPLLDLLFCHRRAELNRRGIRATLLALKGAADEGNPTR